MNWNSTIKLYGLRLVLCILFVTFPLQAQSLHSVFVSVPGNVEESLIGCGPATGQIILGGYPSGACMVLQEDVWTSIISHRVEGSWDTDPVGLKKAIMEVAAAHSCTRANWSVFARSTADALMFNVAYWMTKNGYPAALLKDTVSHNSYTSHQEHWVVIHGIVTDVDPTGSGVSSVNLQLVCFADPSPATLGSSQVNSCEIGSLWNTSLFQPVSKTGSAYFGKYVAVIEPPVMLGRARAAKEVLTGVAINPDDALRYARKWIDEYKFYDMKEYKELKQAKALQPMLVNKDFAGYYIVPYSKDGEKALASVIVNAYTGGFQSVGAFDPVRYVSREDATKIARGYLKDLAGLNPQPEPPSISKLVYPLGERIANRNFPIWEVQIGNRVLGVSQQSRVLTRMPIKDFFVRLSAKHPAGLAWDGKKLWSLDGAGAVKKILTLDPRSGAILKSFTLKAQTPKAMTFDGKLLWIADEGAMKLLAVNPKTGKRVKAIPLQVPAEKGFKSFADIAWDGKYLWTAISAGFSSSLNQIDPKTGAIVRSVFAECDARGIETDGETMWTLCYNGEQMPAKIDRRQIRQKEHEMLRSRKFIKDIAVTQPGGLVYDGQYLWVMDRASKRALKFITPVPAKK